MEYELYRLNELTHHGIKGMKWGVRRYQNKDGSLTPAGKKRQAEKFAREYYKQTRRDQDSYNALQKLKKSNSIVNLYNSESVRAARKEVVKYDKRETDFYNNAKLLDKYQRILAKETSKKFDIPFDKALWGYKYDDFDQGEHNTFDRYLKDTGKYDSYYRGRDRAYKNYNEVCKRAVESYLGEYKNIPVKQVIAKEFNSNHLIVGNTTLQKLFEHALDTRMLDDD